MLFETQNSCAFLVTPEEVADSMLCFMVAGLSEKFHQVTAFYPVSNIDADFLLKCFVETVRSLELAGFEVMLSICDNHASNRKLYVRLSSLSNENFEEDPWIPNPYRPGGTIVLMFDPVHILKCIRNNWFRKTDWIVPQQPGKISWLLLHNLVQHESTMSVKKAFHLTHKVLRPNTFQKMNVSLAMKAFDWRTMNALQYYKDRDPEKFPAEDVTTTVTFMDNIRRWFDIMNINSYKKGPITSMESTKMLELYLIQTYVEGTLIPANILSQETKHAFRTTLRGTFLIIDLLLSSGSKKIFTANFQQDPLEEYFGAQRLRNGCSY